MLEFNKIGMIFDNKHVLNNVNGNIDQGKFVAITGENGCGKTTLIRILAGLQKPTSGSINFYAKDLFSISPKRLAELRSYISSESVCHWDLSVQEVISLGLAHTKIPESERLERIEKLMQKLELEDFKDREINSLSSGEKAQVFLARALVINPDYVFADEILANLHTNNQHKIMGHLKELSLNGKSITLVTHNTNIAEQYCDTIYCLNNTGSLDLESGNSQAKKSYINNLK